MKNFAVRSFLASALLLSAATTAHAGEKAEGLADQCGDFTGVWVGGCDNIPGATLIVTPEADPDPNDPDLEPDVCRELTLTVVFDVFGFPIAANTFKLRPGEDAEHAGLYKEESEGPVSFMESWAISYFEGLTILHLEQTVCIEDKLYGTDSCTDMVGDFTRNGDMVTLVGNMPSGNCWATLQ